MARRICVIGSGQRTVWDDNPEEPPRRAVEAYTSRLFKLALSYAEICCDSLYILSPTLGFLKPDDVLHEHFEDTRKAVRELKTVRDNAKRTMHKVRVSEGDVIVVLGGFWHYDVVRRLFPRNRVVGLLRGLSVNEKYRYLGRLISRIDMGQADCIPGQD